MRLENEILLLKDLTTVLELPHEERQAVLAQLREVYDGRFDKTWGNGKELHWQGRLGFLAGVTPVIDTYYGAMAVLGARFLLFRMEQAGRQETARKALDNAKDEVEQRQKIAQYIAAFMAQLPTVVPTVPEPLYAQLAALTDFVTRCRSGVIRDGYRRELEYAPEPEMPARLAKQLLGLLCGVALVCGHEDATQEDYDRIARVALDCIPAVRRKVLLALATLHDVCGTMDTDAVSTTRVAATAQYSTTAVRRALEDLQALGVLAVEKGGQGKADLWTLLPEWAEAIQTVKKVKTLLDSRRKTAFSEKSGEGGMRNICAETLVGAHPPSPNGTHGTHGTPMDAAEALEEGIL
jgi:hypothetical protein